MKLFGALQSQYADRLTTVTIVVYYEILTDVKVANFWNFKFKIVLIGQIFVEIVGPGRFQAGF